MRDLSAVKDALKNHRIELPSWAFGNCGTRFKVFGQPGVPRDPFEKISTTQRRCTSSPGVAPTMALHIPWDTVDSITPDLAKHAEDNGIAHRRGQLQRLPG